MSTVSTNSSTNGQLCTSVHQNVPFMASPNSPIPELLLLQLPWWLFYMLQLNQESTLVFVFHWSFCQILSSNPEDLASALCDIFAPFIQVASTILMSTLSSEFRLLTICGSRSLMGSDQRGTGTQSITSRNRSYPASL